MIVVPDAVPVTSAALSAFLRGSERRGLVLALLQCGDPAAAERALAAVLRAFRAEAAGHAMADWPVRFWSLLAGLPFLRRPLRPGIWLPPFAALGQMETIDRLALLLRIVAGLEEEVASAVLGVDIHGYRQALVRACPLDAGGHPDAIAWRTLAEAAQQEIRALGPAQLTRLAQLREAAFAGMPVTAAPAGSASVTVGVVRAGTGRYRLREWTQWWRWLVLPRPQRMAVFGVASVLALMVSGVWWWHRRLPALPPEPISQAPAGVLHVTDAAPVLVEDLPAEEMPRPPAVPAQDPRDQAMLADHDLELAQHLDLYAWYAAGHPVPAEEPDAHLGMPTR